jgi:hypothetical protein
VRGVVADLDVLIGIELAERGRQQQLALVVIAMVIDVGDVQLVPREQERHPAARMLAALDRSVGRADPAVPDFLIAADVGELVCEMRNTGEHAGSDEHHKGGHQVHVPDVPCAQ